MSMVEDHVPDSVPPHDRPTRSDPQPWPRYFARLIDTTLLSGIASLFVWVPLAILDPVRMDQLVAASESVAGTLVSNVLAYVLALPLIALLVGTAQTPGKWFLGIRVRRADGGRLGLVMALKRELLVLAKGVGFGLPLINLFTLIASYAMLKEDGRSAWDRSLDCHVLHAPTTWWWWVRACIGGAAALALHVIGAWSLIAAQIG